MELSDDFFLKNKSWDSLSKGDLRLLIDYLEKSYHASLWAELPALIQKLESLRKDKNFCYPHLKEVHLHLKVLAISLFRYMLSEETFLFVSFRKNGAVESCAPGEGIQSLNEIIGLVKHEQAIVKEGFARIRNLCRDYELPLTDPVLPQIYASLRKCETLILEQIFLESNVLFKNLSGKSGTQAVE